MTVLRLSSTVLGSPDPSASAAFYRELLGWQVMQDEPGWVMLRPPGGGSGVSFQLEPDHVPPVWPAGPGDQQMQAHLDVAVHDLAAEARRAVALGARLAQHQPQDDVRVLHDPDGHVFCLFESED
jgi:catechol 2,3-dioxygenase-like lactoylglutathione lyase family enzyme